MLRGLTSTIVLPYDAVRYHQKLNEKIRETKGPNDYNSSWDSIHEKEEIIAQKGDFIVCSTKSTNKKNAARNQMLVDNRLTEYGTEWEVQTRNESTIAKWYATQDCARKEIFQIFLSSSSKNPPGLPGNCKKFCHECLWRFC